MSKLRRCDVSPVLTHFANNKQKTQAAQVNITGQTSTFVETAASKDFRALLAKRASNVESETRLKSSELRALLESLESGQPLAPELQELAKRLEKYYALPSS